MKHMNVDNTQIEKYRLDFLDGIRGFASAMVVISHISAFIKTPQWIIALGLGNPWVTIFITLSGFCLFLPSARKNINDLPYPFVDFMWRRAKRILPAWYGSLLLCILIGLFFLINDYEVSKYFLPQNIWDIITHITLTHSMFRYSGSINGPGYTLGTEWQLYILMALFLYITRKYNWFFLFFIVFLAALPFPGSFGKIIYKIVNPNFTMPFVIGMFAAKCVVCTKFKKTHLIITILIPYILFSFLNSYNYYFAYWLVALSTASACILMTHFPESIGVCIFSSKIAKLFGDFSYSLYLTHFPLLALIGYLTYVMGLEDTKAFWLLFVPSLPIICCFAYLFSLIFEKPFMGRYTNKKLFFAQEKNI